MSNFKTIETQEELDAIIGERLKRKEESVRAEVAKEYANIIASRDELKTRCETQVEELSKLNEALKESAEKSARYEEENGKLSASVRKYETDSVKTRIAYEEGLPFELAYRLSGETEEDIRKDAKVIASYVNRKKVAPLANNNPGGTDSVTASLKGLAAALTEK